MLYFLIVVFSVITLLKFVKVSKYKPILKTQKIMFLAKPKEAIYTSLCLKLNFLSIRNSNIKSLKTLKQTDHIISCVLYGNITVFTQRIDFDVLKEFGIDVNYPLLVIEKVDFFILKCLLIAKRYIQFNIVLRHNNKIKNFNKYNKELNCCILYPNCNLELFSNVMKYNCYTLKKFKVIKKKEYFIVKNKKTKYCQKSINFCVKNINLNDVHIEIKKIKYKDNYYVVMLYNKTQNSQTVKIEYNKNLPINYYKFIKIPNGVFVYDIINNNKKYILNDGNIKLNWSKNNELPNINFKKQIILKPNEIRVINFYVGNRNMSKKLIVSEVCGFYNNLKKILNCKVQIENKKLQYLFNIYLPKQIEFCDYKLEPKIDIININHAYQLFKQKNINALDFYIWLKDVYFGIKETSMTVTVKPLCKDDFSIIYKHHSKDIYINIDRANSNEIYMNIDGVKYKNYLLIPKNKLDIINKVMLVI